MVKSLKLAQDLKTHNIVLFIQKSRTQGFQNVNNIIVTLIVSDLLTMNFDLSFIYISDLYLFLQCQHIPDQYNLRPITP